MFIIILSLCFRAAAVLVLALLFWTQFSHSVLTQAATQTHQNQIRTVERQVLTSPYLPAIRIRFDRELKYVGTQKFTLYERAQAEQFFFVDADNRGRIQRMYLVQFEGYLPGVDAAYDYPATQTVTLGGQTYLVNAETVSNVSDVIKQDPQSDTARAAAFLQSKGLHISNSIRFQRFVRLVGDAKRNELLLIYVEDASKPSTQDKLGKEFLTRAMEGFTILSGQPSPSRNEDGRLSGVVLSKQILIAWPYSTMKAGHADKNGWRGFIVATRAAMIPVL